MERKLSYPPCLQIETLLVGFAHGEGLSGKSSVQDNSFKQIILVHRREEKSHATLFTANPFHHIITMDIIHGCARVLFDEDINKALKGGNIKISHRFFDHEITR